LLVGRRDAIALAREHPLARAMRIDKLSLAALEATLMLLRDGEHVPVLAMLAASEEELLARAERIAVVPAASVVRATSRVGGGALPLLELSGPAVAVPAEWAELLRAGDPPIVGRIHDGRLLLDPRTLTDEEAGLVGLALLSLWSRRRP
jgi:L-seryl-tRNA(Ser) seleniumtransferase